MRHSKPDIEAIDNEPLIRLVKRIEITYNQSLGKISISVKKTTEKKGVLPLIQ